MKKQKRMKRGDINTILNKLKTEQNPYHLKRGINREKSYKSIKETLYRERKPNYKKKVNMLHFVLDDEKFKRLNRIEEDDSAGKGRLGDHPILPKVISCSLVKRKGTEGSRSGVVGRKNSNLRYDRNWTKVQELIKENRKEVAGLGAIDMRRILDSDRSRLKETLSMSPDAVLGRSKRKKINIFYNFNSMPKTTKISKKYNRRNFYSLMSEDRVDRDGNRRNLFRRKNAKS